MKQTADVVDLLVAILRGAPALPGAACASADPKLFDGTDPAGTESAIALCRYRCPVLAACAEWAETAPHDSLHGVVGGRWHEWTPATVRGRRELQGASS
jgi:hypothetical protein